MHHDGYEYLYHVNKFLKGTDVSQVNSYCDIETRNALYELKGMKLYYFDTNNRLRFNTYQIDIAHHTQLKVEADKIIKTAKYMFLLKVGNRMIFRSIPWTEINELINLNQNQFRRKDNDKLIFKLKINEVW